MEQVKTYVLKNSLWFFAIAFSPFLSVVLWIISRIYFISMQYSSENSTAGLNIGGLTISEAMEEIKTLSSIPLELKYQKV